MEYGTYNKTAYKISTICPSIERLVKSVTWSKYQYFFFNFLNTNTPVLSYDKCSWSFLNQNNSLLLYVKL
jgi:hypothetical protein